MRRDAATDTSRLEGRDTRAPSIRSARTRWEDSPRTHHDVVESRIVSPIAHLIVFWILGGAPAPPQEIQASDYVIYATVDPVLMGATLSPCLQFSAADGSRIILSLSETSAAFQRVASDGVSRDLATWPLAEPATPPIEIQVRSWDGSHRLIVNGFLVGQTQGPLPGPGGSVGPHPGCKASGVRIQPLAKISLSDDFMREDIALGDWEAHSGEWEIAAIDHPDMSTAGFTLKGSGSGSLIVGQDFWDDEILQVSLKIASLLGDIVAGKDERFKEWLFPVS